MAKKIYGLSAADKKLVQETIARSVGGFKRRRPTNKRRRFAGGGGGGGGLRAAILNETISACLITGSGSSSTPTPGTGKGFILTIDWSEVDDTIGSGGQIDVENYSYTKLVATASVPVVVMGDWDGKAEKFRAAPFDMRSLFNFDKTKFQLPVHDATKDSFELMTLVEVLKKLTSWTAGSNQSVGHDSGGDPLWQNDETC